MQAGQRPRHKLPRANGKHGARDRVRTGDPQLGKLVSESGESTPKSSSYEIFKTDLVPAENRLSRLDGGE
jgi:hypothetical protein